MADQVHITGPLAPQYLRCEYHVDPSGIDVRRPRLSWEVSDPRRGAVQSAYRVLVAGSLASLNDDRGDLWDSGTVASDQTSQVAYAGGPLTSRAVCFWKVRTWGGAGVASPWSGPGRWSMGLLYPGDWVAEWIGYDEDVGEPFDPLTPYFSGRRAADGENRLYLPPPPYLRKAFETRQDVRRAVVYVSALGLYELHINGRRVGDDCFAPGWTDYPKRVYYNTYDVTDLLRSGENAVGAVLADGWFAGYIGARPRHFYGDEPRLLLQLEIELADGSTQTVASDGSWRATYGAFREADLIHGEVYDARLEMPGWDMPDFAEAGWRPVVAGTPPELAPREDRPGISRIRSGRSLSPRLEAHPGEPVSRSGELPAREMANPKPGVYVFDMGQNFAGIARLKVSGRSGDTVRMRFAEALSPDGTIYTENLRGARAADTYILKGGGEETWEPAFTFHGFRYVELTGYPGEPGLDAVTGVAIESATPAAGTFQCSNPMVDQLYRNIVWTQRSNFLEVPTDCPQRDERLGWTGDAQAFIRTASYNRDVAAFFTKWLTDLADTRNDEGAVQTVAPDLGLGYGEPAWSDAMVICPWNLYLVYGDTRIIERHYDGMVAWVEFLRRRCEGYLRKAGDFQKGKGGFGDWLAINAETPWELIGTAYFARCARLLSRMALAIGRRGDAECYEDLFGKISAAFVAKYVGGDGRMDPETQTGYALALKFELLSQDLREAAARHLAADIEGRGGHLSTGVVGLSLIAPALTEAGRTDVAYRLLTNETYPSWGYSIKNGATTVWERWDSWTKDRGFQTPEMNSLNHYALGSIGEWLLSTVAGIDTDGPGYRRIMIRPRNGGGLTHARASYRSIQGSIVSSWRVDRGRFYLEATVPANTTATVYVPPGAPHEVLEGGGPAAEVEGVELLRMEEGAAIFRVAAGSYRFEADVRF